MSNQYISSYKWCNNVSPQIKDSVNFGKGSAKVGFMLTEFKLVFIFFIKNFQSDEGVEGEDVGEDEEGDDIKVSFAVSWRWILFWWMMLRLLTVEKREAYRV